MSETENVTGAASRGRKLQSTSVRTLEASIVQYCDKCHCILIQVRDTRQDIYNKIFIYVEGLNFSVTSSSLMSTIRKLEFLGLL